MHELEADALLYEPGEQLVQRNACSTAKQKAWTHCGYSNVSLSMLSEAPEYVPGPQTVQFDLPSELK